MQKILLLICSISTTLVGYSQQNTVASGGDGSGTGGSFSYSIGQIDYINTSGSLNVSEGVQQPHEFYEVVGLSDLNSIITSIYPNPASESIILELNRVDSDLRYDLFDVRGRLISTSQIKESKSIIDIKALSQGSYILEISEPNKPLTTIKFIKY